MSRPRLARFIAARNIAQQFQLNTYIRMQRGGEKGGYSLLADVSDIYQKYVTKRKLNYARSAGIQKYPARGKVLYSDGPACGRSECVCRTR